MMEDLGTRTERPQVALSVFQIDSRRDLAGRAFGNLVSLSGIHGTISSRLTPGGITESWSIGHLITLVNNTARVVGVVSEISIANQVWSETEANIAQVKVELIGEIIDDEAGNPAFFRGIRSYPPLGALAHRIRTSDLEAIYSFRGNEGVEVGRLSQNEAIPAKVNLKEMISRHFAVLGSTGVGKTTLVSSLVQLSLKARPKLRALIIDPHNEYAGHFSQNSITMDSDSLDIPYWVFRFEEFLDIVYAGRKPNSDEIDALFDLIKAAKGKFAAQGSSAAQPSSIIRRAAGPEAGSISADTPVPYRFADLIQVIDDWMGKLDQRYPRSDLRALKHRLDTLNKDPRFRFMFGKGTVEDNLARVLGRLFRIPTDGMPVTIIQLAGLPNEVVNSVVSVLARLAFDIAVWSNGQIEIALICEEAHRYIPSDPTLGFWPTRQAIGRIAKEGRKYGSSLCVVSQRPSELDPTVLSQCSTMFTMRLPNENDKAIIRSAIAESSASILASLSSIADREAIVFGEAVPSAMRIKVHRYVPAPRVAHDPHDQRPREDFFDLRKLVMRLRGE